MYLTNVFSKFFTLTTAIVNHRTNLIIYFVLFCSIQSLYQHLYTNLFIDPHVLS